MARAGGNPKLKEINRKGRGRPVGAKGKIGLKMKDLVEGALEELGGQKFLVKLGRENPKDLIPLLAKLMPREDNVNLSGDIGVKVQWPLGKTDLDE